MQKKSLQDKIQHHTLEQEYAGPKSAKKLVSIGRQKYPIFSNISYYKKKTKFYMKIMDERGHLVDDQHVILQVFIMYFAGDLQGTRCNSTSGHSNVQRYPLLIMNG